MGDDADTLLAELMAPAGTADPYPIYDRMREAAPVFKSALGPWILTRYDDCRAVLRDARYGKDWQGFMANSGIEDWRDHPSTAYGETSLLFANPPEHTRLRGLVSKAFTPRTVDRLRASMRQIIDALLDPLAEAGGGDLLDALAFPLPVTVIGQLLGVPAADRMEFRDRVRLNTATLELGVTHAQIALADEAAIWMVDYFEGLVAEKRARPAQDLLSGMIEVEVDGDKLSDQEIVGMGLLLFGAGFETTTNLIGNGVLALLRNPDQLAWLREHPGGIAGTVEELLRYDASIQVSGRAALEDAELAGHTVAEGDAVLTILGAANRDPERYPHPHRLDLTRRDIEPLSFGSGIHFCLGASLARAEGDEALRALLGRFGEIELADEPRFRHQLGFRGLESLPVRCRG
jgi:cytochrome P450